MRVFLIFVGAGAPLLAGDAAYDADFGALRASGRESATEREWPTSEEAV